MTTKTSPESRYTQQEAKPRVPQQNIDNFVEAYSDAISRYLQKQSEPVEFSELRTACLVALFDSGMDMVAAYHLTDDAFRNGELDGMFAVTSQGYIVYTGPTEEI